MLVVFVDDEPGVLHGIERMLLAQRVPWDVFCIPDPQEAIELIDRTPVDVVVADLKMPRIDGAELLRHVRETERQKLCVEHIKRILPAVRQVAEIRDRAKWNGQYRMINPPDFL